MKQNEVKFSKYPNSQKLAEFLGERSEKTRAFIIKILGKKVNMSGFIGSYMASSEAKGSWGKKRALAERQFFYMMENGWIEGVIDEEIVSRAKRIIEKAGV